MTPFIAFLSGINNYKGQKDKKKVALIDINRKEIFCKIVYYGPARSGKTTNLVYIYNAIDEKKRGKLLTIETKGDNTLFFDLLPLNLGLIKGFDVKLQLYTVPGQEAYANTQKLVIKGVDGLVFVADSLEIRRKKNIESINRLKQNLSFYSLSIEEIPLVFQYNKRDLTKTSIPMLSVENLQTDLNNTLKRPYFETSAIKGWGVFETLKEISKMTVRYALKKYYQ